MTALFGIHPETMVLPLMFLGIGFLFAAIIAVALSPAIHRRAERLTRRRLQDHIPQSVQELRAEKDHLRAEHAMAARNLTLGMEKLHEKAALQSAELGRKTEEANRLKIALEKKDAALAALEQRAAGIDDGSADLRADLAAAQFEANAGRLALREAEQAIMTLQAEIADLTAAVESRSRLIDRQQHDIMALTAQIDRISKAPAGIPAPVVAQAAMKVQETMQPVMQAALPVAPAPLKTAPANPVANPISSPMRAASTVSFESRLAAIRDDKPLRDVRPQALAKRAVTIEPAPQIAQAPAAKPQLTKSQFLNSLIAKPEIAKEIVKAAQASVEKPAPKPQAPAARADAEPARVSTDIRYDEPLTTADLLELGKAMLRQSSKDGLPHKTH
jgi:predicted  nucleic acid-binding Zn-ribbon protein